MSRRSASQVSAERLAAYLEGDAEASEQFAIERALAEDPEARRILADIGELERALAAPVPELEGLDMRQRVHVAVAGRLGRRPRVAPLLWSGGLSALAAAVCLGWISASRPAETPEFRAKGAIRAVADGQRWSGIRVYRALSDREAEPIDGTLSLGDRLLFSYTNLAHPPFTHLVLFAVDASGRVHFYYPSYEQPGVDPAAVPIRSGADEVLPDLISHDYSTGPLVLQAVFSRRPIPVSEVERLLREHRGGLRDEQLPDASIQTLQLRVGARE